MNEEKKNKSAKHAVMNVLATVCRCVIAAYLVSVGVGSYLNSVNTPKIIISENASAPLVHSADCIIAASSAVQTSIPTEISTDNGTPETVADSSSVQSEQSAQSALPQTTPTASSDSVQNQATSAITAPQTTAAPQTAIQSGLININTADAETLTQLPGIGEVKAAAIVAYREQSGAFRSVDELTEVSGIGEKTLEKLRPLITV